jgi:hypothetical protein
MHILWLNYFHLLIRSQFLTIREYRPHVLENTDHKFDK